MYIGRMCFKLIQVETFCHFPKKPLPIKNYYWYIWIFLSVLLLINSVIIQFVYHVFFIFCFVFKSSATKKLIFKVVNMVFILNFVDLNSTKGTISKKYKCKTRHKRYKFVKMFSKIFSYFFVKTFMEGISDLSKFVVSGTESLWCYNEFVPNFIIVTVTSYFDVRGSIYVVLLIKV